MKKRIVSFLLAILLLIPAESLAWFDQLYNSYNFLEIEGEGVGFYISDLETFTFVTPQTLEENMDLCLSRGGTREEIRMRMNTGNVLWEAYSPRYPRGRLRLEVYEDEYSRCVWNLKDLLANQVRRVATDMDSQLWLHDRYHFFNSKKRNEYERQTITGSFNAYPPYAYESGIYCLAFHNGKGYLLLYAQDTPASSAALLNRNADDPALELGQRCNYNRLSWLENPGNDNTHFARGIFKGISQAETPPADLKRDYTRGIFNLNSGAYEYTGFTEGNATVTVSAGGEEVKAKVDSETKMFSAQIQLQPGENEITVRAEKKNLEPNTLTDVLTVNDDMAMLVLTEYLYGDEDRSKLRIAGVTNPGATITIQVDEEEPIQVEVKKNGKFSQKITAEDFKEHTVTVTASQEGKEDCTVRTPFTTYYADDNKHAAAYRKLLNKEIHWVDAFEKPGEYVGEKISMLIRTTNQEYTNGMLIVEGTNIGSASRPLEKGKNKCYLVFDSYVDDFLALSCDLTAYGEIIEPAHMEDGDYLRMQVEFFSYYKK